MALIGNKNAHSIMLIIYQHFFLHSSFLLLLLLLFLLLLLIAFNMMTDDRIRKERDGEGQGKACGVGGKLTITSERKDNQVTVSVKDTGTGIDPEMFPKLFSRFASKSFSGTGLGLFISKSIIEEHSGKIWAQNNPDGRGATFSFTIPLANNLIANRLGKVEE